MVRAVVARTAVLAGEGGILLLSSMLSCFCVVWPMRLGGGGSSERGGRPTVNDWDGFLEMILLVLNENF